MRRYTTTYAHRECAHDHYKRMVDRGWTCIADCEYNGMMWRFRWRETLPTCLRRVTAHVCRRTLDWMDCAATYILFALWTALLFAIGFMAGRAVVMILRGTL